MNENEQIKDIYNQINETHKYLMDTTMKSLTAIAFYEMEKEKGISLPYNAIVNYIGVDNYADICKTAMPECFMPLEYVLTHYKENEPYKLIISTFKAGVEDFLELNIVKRTCQELGMTYKELGEAIGYSGDSLRNIASKKNVSDQITKAISLYLETLDLKSQLKDYTTLKEILKNIVK